MARAPSKPGTRKPRLRAVPTGAGAGGADQASVSDEKAAADAFLQTEKEAAAGPDRTKSGKRRRLNLALQGGGSHGAFAWGALDYLLEHDLFDIDGVSATSAGAMNAVAMAAGRRRGGTEGARQALEDFWRAVSDFGAVWSPVKATPFDPMLKAFGIEENASFAFFDALTRAVSPYDMNPLNLHPLRDILERSVDFEDLRNCQETKLFISATHVPTGTVKVFETKDVSADVVLASACLPYLFQAVEIDGEPYWDGGFMGNPALFPLFYGCSCEDVLIVHINPLYRPGTPKTASQILNRMNEITFNAALLKEFRAIAFVKKLIHDGWLKDEYAKRLRDVKIHSLRADEATLGLSVASKFKSDWGFLTELRDRGRAIAQGWFETHGDKVGVASSVDIRSNFLELGPHY